MYQGSIEERFLQQLYTHLNWQSQKMNQLEKMIEQLQSEMTSLKQQRPTNIEKIEYNFDQLKVEKLEGILNIGLSPNGSKSIEDFAVNHQAAQDLSVQSRHDELFQPILHRVHQYLDTEIPNKIKLLEEKYDCMLDETYRRFIIQDVKKQLDQRIRHYLHQMDEEVTTHDTAFIQQTIIKKMEHDIGIAIEEYIKNLPQGGATLK
jgi:spore germination protein PC